MLYEMIKLKNAILDSKYRTKYRYYCHIDNANDNLKGNKYKKILI